MDGERKRKKGGGVTQGRWERTRNLMKAAGERVEDL